LLFFLTLNQQKLGELTIGGTDPNHYVGALQWVPVTKRDNQYQFWQTTLTSIKVGGASVASLHIAVLDSGTSYLVGPTADANKIYKLIGATDSNGTMTVPCNNVSSLPNIVITLNGNVVLPLTSQYYVDSTFASQNFCKVVIGGGDSDEWLLGDPFFRRYYTVFNAGQHKMGIAVAKP